ncbi:hypothetical protein [Salinarimonas ramus]|uniref:Uncharacterized protein n=1 Tax=Salinarimonas ramus TaxID=690164 RepID=A0A917V917_9HYPH|nr:hypothetical protein [Salinarimonas ramus]GGK51775.1 hypothetical protein GCM10011322_43520 [Salinarimonas ramus]
MILTSSGEAPASPRAPVWVRHLTPDPAGARLILSPGSPLIAGVASACEADMLLEEPALGGAAGYVLIDWPHAVRVGETLDMAGRWAAHRGAPPLPIEQVFIVASLPELRAGRDTTLALQSILHRLARESGRCALIGAAPSPSPLESSDSALVARWASDIRGLLLAGIGPLFEPCAARLQPRAVEATPPEPPVGVLRPVSVGYALDVPGGVALWPDAMRYRLEWRGARASAAVVDGVTVVESGSLVMATETPCIQPCIARKRARLQAEGVLAPTRNPQLLRLAKPVRLPSLINGARVVTGSNTGVDVWRPI